MGSLLLICIKSILGEKSRTPSSILLYPLDNPDGKKDPVVRTILNIMTKINQWYSAGDVPVDSRVQLMMASVDGIAQGAPTAPGGDD
jgi:hypothetical protein